MLQRHIFREGVRALSRPASLASRAHLRTFSVSPRFFKDEPHKGEVGDHVGSFSRTDKEVQIEYPEEKNLPRSVPVQGRGGYHFKRTLASFSLEGNVGLVTGGARGLGLVMSQALVVSGADVAIVDLNSEWRPSVKLVTIDL